MHLGCTLTVGGCWEAWRLHLSLTYPPCSDKQARAGGPRREWALWMYSTALWHHRPQSKRGGMHSRSRSWPRCDEFLNSKAKNPSGPGLVLGKHERQALNLNATFLSCVVASISPAVLLFLASGWIFQLCSRFLKSYFSGKIIVFNVSILVILRQFHTHIH